jgi:hypothetical protein
LRGNESRADQGWTGPTGCTTGGWPFRLSRRPDVDVVHAWPSLHTLMAARRLRWPLSVSPNTHTAHAVEQICWRTTCSA